MAYISDDYIACPVAKISGYLKISEAIAGATLLALANGICDILTVILASHKDNTDLAVGVLFGANLFLVFVVLGTVILLTKVQLVDKVPSPYIVGSNHSTI